jgi:hypothetical protein
LTEATPEEVRIATDAQKRDDEHAWRRSSEEEEPQGIQAVAGTGPISLRIGMP